MNLLLAFLLAATPARPARHVVVVSIDGLRPDAITDTRAPNLRALIRRGAYAPRARTIQPSITLPSHASMLTGLDYARHGVTWNGYRRGRILHPTILSIAHARGLATAMFFSKDKFQYLADPAALDLSFGPGPGERYADSTTAAAVGDAFARAWARRRYDLVFVHLREPDEAGHEIGWMTPAYLRAVREADAGVGRIVAALRARGDLDRTAILVSADHGGHARRHDKPRPENWTIPWIAAGPGIARRTIDRDVRIFDMAPTALRLLGIDPPRDWDGRAVEEVFTPTATRPRRASPRR